MQHNPTTALVIAPGESTPLISSRTIAESFGKDHKNVLSRIKDLMGECPPEFNQLNFKPISYIDQRNRPQNHYLLTRDAFSLLVMGFTGPEALRWKLRYIEAFNALERELLGQRLLDRPEGRALITQGLLLAKRLTPKRRRQIKKAEAYQALGLTYHEIARLLNVGPKKAKNLLWEGEITKGGAA